LTWEAVIPGFNHILKKLLDTDFGVAIEFDETPCPTPAAMQD
jgi:hypothetical protein